MEAARRLRWIDHYYQHRHAWLACRHFGTISETFYRGESRLDPYKLRTLEEESPRSCQVHQAQAPHKALLDPDLGTSNTFSI
ncbi:MAG: hypothetical protein PHQ25_08015 [Acidobacteriota bacterium]|nr:hypothetical protein [Acidobacteriota bacterium]MDW3229316.1 hypothetical protein [Acidobacteriota bacterium]